MTLRIFNPTTIFPDFISLVRADFKNMMVSDNAISATTSKVRIISGGGYLTDENGFPVDNLVNLPKCVENSFQTQRSEQQCYPGR